MSHIWSGMFWQMFRVSLCLPCHKNVSCYSWPQQALPDLLDFWSKHGFGLVGKFSALQWTGSSGGALTAAPASKDPQQRLACTGTSDMTLLRADACVQIPCSIICFTAGVPIVVSSSTGL